MPRRRPYDDGDWSIQPAHEAQDLRGNVIRCPLTVVDDEVRDIGCVEPTGAVQEARVQIPVWLRLPTGKTLPDEPERDPQLHDRRRRAGYCARHITKRFQDPAEDAGVRRRRSESSTRCRRDSGMRPARSTDRRAQPATNTPATRDRPERAGRRRHEASGPHSARWSTWRFPPTRTARAPAPDREWGPCSDCGHQGVQIRGPLRDGGDRSAVVASWRPWLVSPEPDRSEAGCRPGPLASLTSPSNGSPDVSVRRNTTAPAMSRLVGSASSMNRQPPAT